MATWIKQIKSSSSLRPREREERFLFSHTITEREIDLILHGVDTKERERSESDEMGFY